jgi:protein SCO1/2
MVQQKSSFLIKLVVFFLLLLSLAIVWERSFQKPVVPQALQGVLRPEPRSLKPFELVDQNESLINEEIFKNKWSFVFFGYMSCPDVCPVTLHVLNTVTDMLKKKDAELLLDTQVIFVSVDPARDTADKLLDYVTFFNREFIGVTGDKKNIDNITQQFNAGYMRGQEIAPGEYLVSHTSAVFLVAPDAALVASFSQPHIPGTIVSQYEAIRMYLLK